MSIALNVTGVPDSKTFDVTLIICLIRNLTSIISPINGFDSLPLQAETTSGSDLARIKWYRNKLAHPDSNTIDRAHFNTAWGDISDAVVRLGGPTMYQECQELKVNSLDQSNQENVLEIKQALEELRQTTENLGTKLSKVEEILDDPIPPNIRDQIKKQIEDWKKTDKMFVSTRASDYVMKCLQDKSCVTLTAPSGVGKTFISKHTALVLQKEGYKIILVYSPKDIRDFYQPGKQTVFIVDDICGNFTANRQQIDDWKQLLPVINTIIADKCCKIIVSCRLQVYKDEKFNILLPFKSCECNLVSDKLCLTSIEKQNIAKTYIGTSMQYIDEFSYNWDFFPLLCSLYHKNKKIDVKEFFKSPFGVYKDELDKLSEHGDEGNYKVCSLALCVLFNNQLKENWFQGKMTDEQRHIIEDTCDACYINRSTSKAKLKKELDTLNGTYICKQNGIYSTIHDKLFDFLAHYFGQKMIECFIDYGDSDLVRERFIWEKLLDKKTSNIDFIIKLSDDYLESYLQRLIKDWFSGKVTVVIKNTNMQMSLFRQKLLEQLKHLDLSKQVELVNTKDIVVPKESHNSGNTPLIVACCDGYTDMVQWMLHVCFDLNVDQCRDNGAAGLFIASQEGHTDLVKLILKRNPKIDRGNKHGSSPLNMASMNGHTDVVRLLLERHPNVDISNKDGCSSLFWASQEGYTDIVKLLLEKNPKVDICNKFGYTPLIKACAGNHTSIVQLLMRHKPDINTKAFDGGSALYFSAMNGNIEITQLLLENKANCDICIHSKQSITDTLNNHPSVTLDKEKQGLFDSLVSSTSSRVTDYVSKKSLDYAFDVVAGSYPLHIACFMGRIHIVRCLIDHNDNINRTKEDGTTPLFYACEVGHHDIVRLLLDKGANTQICRIDDKTPLNIATDNGHKSIVVIVREHTEKEKQLPL
ncbi:unnamed protein product [Mytilus coruscus]|uniref:Uncharacterized protein n=1 Tax=Mytilus coruscus TaxID=42192 RepID=A0A6J8DT96_MYTCO|nr:unnamed protein product [Mytilus coruscus]